MPMRCCLGFISPTICRVNEKTAPFPNQLYNPIDMFDVHPPHRLTPYEAAKLNGTVALLPLEPIRLYGRVETMHEFLATATTSWAHALNEVNAFKKRFNFAALAS